MPHGDPYQQIAVRLEPELYQTIRRLAAADGVTAAQWIRTALRDAARKKGKP